MVWERRGNSCYYYRKKRIGNRIVSEYIGSGETAFLFARLDEIGSEEKNIEREKDALIRQELAAKSLCIERLHKANAEIVEFVLKSLGFHRHKGQWRKKRNADIIS